MMLPKKFRLLPVLLFVVCFRADADLEILVRSVGQGNCIAVKRGSKAILLDAGVHQFGGYRRMYEQDPATDPVLNFLKNCEVNVFVSHTHYDHYSLLDYFFRNKGVHKINFGTVYCSDFAASGAYKTARRRWINENHVAVRSVNSLRDLADISGLLGDGIQIDSVIPENWPVVGKNNKAKRSKDPNDNSLVLVITDHIDGKKFLFTGDATGATLDQTIRSDENLRKLVNIDCIVVPHHGSNAAGAFSWFHFVRDNVESGYNLPLLAIISSDPTECDFLPWFGVRLFNCSRGVDPKCCEEHFVATNAGAGAPIGAPVFVTSNSSGFLKISSRSKVIALFDGEKNSDPLFLSNEPASPEVELESQLSQLLLQGDIGGAIAATQNVSLTTNMLLMLSEFGGVNEIREILISTLRGKLSDGSMNETEFLLSLDYEELSGVVLKKVKKDQKFLGGNLLLKMSKLSSYRDFLKDYLLQIAKNDQLLDNTERFVVSMDLFRGDQNYEAYIKSALGNLPLDASREGIWLQAITNGYLTEEAVSEWLKAPDSIPDSVISQISIFAEESNYGQCLMKIVQARLSANLPTIGKIMELNAAIEQTDVGCEELPMWKQEREQLQKQLTISDVVLENAMRFDELRKGVANVLRCVPQLSEMVLLEAMKYEDFNGAVIQVLRNSVPLEESDFCFYIKHLKDINNLVLLHQVVELTMEAAVDE